MSECHTFCDWITVKQHHGPGLPIVSDGACIQLNESGEEEFTSLKFKNLTGLHNTNFQIRSDGRTVEASGNIGKFNSADKVHGVSLDDCKIKLNQLLQSNNLPPFTDAELVLLPGRTSPAVIRGATISRIDMMRNFAAGSAYRREKYLQWLNTQTHPTLKLKTVYQSGNMYFGKGEGTRSQTRFIRIYDKALDLQTKELKQKGADKAHLQSVIEELDCLGTFRIEQQYHKYLKANNIRLWQNATHTILCEHLQKDIDLMNKPISVEDLDDIPRKLLGTLTMYLMGINPRSKISRNIYSQHKRELKELGYDISNITNVHRIKPKPLTIEIRDLRPDECLGKITATLKSV